MEQEIKVRVGIWRLQAISQLMEEYAYKNRAKIVQRLIELKHREEQKLELNKPLEAQYGCQTPAPKDKLLGEISHITNNDKGGPNNRSISNRSAPVNL